MRTSSSQMRNQEASLTRRTQTTPRRHTPTRGPWRERYPTDTGRPRSLRRGHSRHRFLSAGALSGVIVQAWGFAMLTLIAALATTPFIVLATRRIRS
jgi:hypothetical protein